ncbi:hypothetical protein L226DRAFT_565548 [Lentinus tigrinus ALCF2SS1-7]|uniref:Yeast cell wall synthesis Kre9/Knh1-like N-terminal domain-containing protein n=1 Tax=Lentinus tigrinus ALCF2SS1-6 TaxID=1328759 RepID=A0A5C2SUG7_9APHY|nr:hypothetical protein L227DRAFT_605209 [Lentinus tigrinus ALCF2SS1-6]RPD80701.1 hypothetical protein L226DRAFT_565548 [Lentinus tigrinus ALCF2SS1-7]
MRSVATLLAFAASALAYQVTQPTNATGWTLTGPNVVAWDKVSTDRANFTIVLVNQAVYPPTSQVLAALVDGTKGSMTVNPPSEGWKAGSGFQVNLVQDSENLNSILAQSNQFTISQASSSLSATTTGSVTQGSSVLTVTPTGSTATVATTGSTTDALNPTSSDTSTTPTGSNGASASMGMQAGLFAGLALLGAFLA